MDKKKEAFESVSKVILPKIGDLNFPNRKLLICFASTPAGGKTVLSNALQKKFNSIVINSGDIQRELEKFRDQQFYEGFIQEKREFIYWLMSKIVREYDNKFIILDKCIDRTYEEVDKWCKENKYPFIVISLEVNKDELKRRLVKREGNNADDYLVHLDRWFNEHEEFKKNYKYDLSFNTERKSVESIVKKIDKKLNSSF